ncbi:hypothetical protein J7E45_09390 [Microbacterium sp. ISL-59]|uniref:hypothetical protein n=1 Tax=Microbacterium sp. ISL-59 TaxID=2819159 RepID=UPI001BECA414|nr:hypothetical protein [Microbacterium sp. ISL-59]MBT2495821.1 hypothetical protein [Microbacterium sp. ISL-59]
MERYRSFGAIAAVAVLAALSVQAPAAGALVTRDSTIVNNEFTHVPPPPPPPLAVEGSPIRYDYIGAINGEKTFEVFTVTNQSQTNAVLDIRAARQYGPDPELELKFARLLSTQVISGEVTIKTGRLDAMQIPSASRIAFAPGESKQIRVEVFVEDAAEFQAAGIPRDTGLTFNLNFRATFE